MFFCRLNLSVNFIFPNHSPNLFLPFCFKIPSMYLTKCNSNMNRKDYNQIQSTQASDKKIYCKRASQCASNRGSVTVEAALVLPFFFFVLYAILLISQFLMTEDRIYGALVETGRVLAGEETERVTLAKAQMELRKQLNSHNLNMVSGGVSGISLGSSRLPNNQHEIELHADYRMKVSIPFLFTVSVPVQVTVIQRMFDGCHITDTSEGGGGNYVYVAEHESVYHTSSQCTHIAIRLISAKDASALAGKRQCKSCKNNHETGEYVTLTGDCVHQNPQCSRIRRTVYMIEKDKAGNLPLCSRCAKRE